jgi:23S rRNA (uracil1939-C5)-methyltransferase
VTASVSVRIERLAAGGDGIGRLADGRVVFVPRTAPGDLVELARLDQRARFARGESGRVLEPGPGRVEPRCPHYVADRCGGCQLQHLDGATQREAKRVFVADALSRIGRLAVEVPSLRPSGQEWEYRRRISLAVGPGRRFAGFHPLERPDQVFPLRYCHLAAPALMELWQRLRPLLHLLPADVEQLQLRLDPAGLPHLIVRALGEQAWGDGPVLGERLGSPATVWWQPEGGAPRVVSGADEAYPATVFEQINPTLGAEIREFAVGELGEVRDRLVWDLYAGTGETSERLHALGASVESVELDRRAVEQGERRTPGAAVRHVGRAEDLVRRLKDPFAVITNPPRTGMDRAVVAELVRRAPVRVVYVSCDPATLARDLSLLCGTATGQQPAARYRVVAVQPFDLFPQTAHVETVAALEVT